MRFVPALLGSSALLLSTGLTTVLTSGCSGGNGGSGGAGGSGSGSASTQSGANGTASNGSGSGTASNGSSATSTGANGTGSAGTASTGSGMPQSAIQHVFVIVMENKAWSSIKGDSGAPYINSLLSVGAHAENYHNPPNNHPSEPNYIWLEAGSNLGITTDDLPSVNHQGTTAHLTAQLDAANVPWKSYQDGIDGTTCELANISANDYAVRHNPMVYFDDQTNNQDPSSAHCISHVRPFDELQTDLNNNTVARYNFITPNLCHDMHGFSGNCVNPLKYVENGDTWLSTVVPMIQASQAYQSGAIFITWDECDNFEVQSCEDPIGMIILSPFAKPGHQNTTPYDHSSALRTFQEILGVGPLLGGAATATDLSDMFNTFP